MGPQLAWAFLVAVAYWPGVYQGEFAPRWAVMAIGIPFMSSFKLSEIHVPIRWLLLAGLVWSISSIYRSPAPLNGTLEAMYLTILCGVFLVGAGLDSLDSAMKGLALGIGVSSVLCLPQFFLEWNYFPQQVVPAGLFYNRELLAEFTAPVFLYWLVSKKLPYALLTAVPLLLCQSRVAVFAVAVGLFWAWMPRSKFLRAFLAADILILAVAALLLLGQYKFNEAGLRFVLWGATAMAITPLGNGLGWFSVAHPIEIFAHSDVLQSIAELGVGSIFFLAIMPIIFWRKHGSIAARAAFLAISTQAFISFPLHIPASGFLAALCAGYLASTRVAVRRKQPDRSMVDFPGVRRPAASGYTNPYVGGYRRDALPV